MTGAKRPLIAQLNNRLNTNDFWLDSLRDVDVVPERVGQITRAIPTIQAVTIADIQALARRYFQPALALRVSVTSTAPAPTTPTSMVPHKGG